MSSNADRASDTLKRPSAAADVSFARLVQQHGESSSQAGSSWSSEKRSSRGDGGSESGGGGAGDGGRDSWEVEGSSRGSSNTSNNRVEGERTIDVKTRQKRRSGGFLLDSVFGTGPPMEGKVGGDRNGKRKAPDTRLQVEKRRLGPSRLSGESSHPGSPLSREVSMDHGSPDGPQQPQRPLSMDAAQLVQMALELSESRRRHASGSLHIPAASPSRRISGRSSQFGTVQSRKASGRQRASYLSDEILRDSPSSRRSGTVEAYDDNPGFEALQVPPLDVPDIFTPATLSRAERARKYFELASEHRRLLQYLPPLKPDANAPGYRNSSHSSPHSAQANTTRLGAFEDSKYELGRSYNPLQALRNRRLRARERRPLSTPPEAWQDTDVIALWIDGVETATGDQKYRAVADRVQLPPFGRDGEATSVSRDVVKGHRRMDTASSVITRPENGWSIEPSELLADAYWTEHGDNKATLENRYGNFIFPNMPRANGEQPRRSMETTRLLHEKDKTDSGTDGGTAVPKRTRTSRLTHLAPRRPKRITRISRSPSTSSGSSDEDRPPPALVYGSEGGVLNTGPLERHMQDMIAKEEQDEQSPPEVNSPDHWDTRQTAFPVLQSHAGRSRRDTLSQGNGQLKIPTASHHRRAKSADGRFGARDTSSIEDMSSVEAALIGLDYVPGMEPTLSPSGTGHLSPTQQQKGKRHRLPLFRSRVKDEDQVDRTDFAAGVEPKPLPRPSTDLRSSQESSRPSFFTQRQRTNESFNSSHRRQGTQNTSSGTNGSVKEPVSAVGRFFKAGRIGDLVRNESSRLGGRFRGSKDRLDDVAADGSELSFSDTSDLDEDDGRSKPTIVADDNDDEASPRTSADRTGARPKFHTQNLPTFKSPVARNNNAGLLAAGNDPISHQQRAQREAGRSPRFDRLAPPRINLPGGENGVGVSPEVVADESAVQDDRCKSYGLLGRNSQGALGINVDSGVLFDTRLNKLKSEDQVHGRRHWSISDRLRPEVKTSNRVTMRDIARVRALLLSSGVKAREIQRRADAARDVPSPTFQSAITFLGQPLNPNVSRREEYLVLSRLLIQKLASTSSTFEQALEAFAQQQTKHLTSRLDELERKASDQLTKLVSETSDDAEAFVVELTTKQPQDVKRVDDAIDDMLRQRRRQFRLIRRAGFKVLEWLVLGIMWGVWFVVTLLNGIKRGGVVLLGFVRWLFWF